MEYKNARSLIARLANQVKLLSAAIAGLLLCNALLGLLLWHQSGRKDIVLIPAGLKQKANITQSGVNSAYLESMAMMLVNDRLNITPDNVAGSNQDLLTFVEPGFYHAFKKQLATDAAAIQSGKIASSFYVNRVRSNPKSLMVVVSGQLKRWVGERLIGSEAKRYQLTFSMSGYQLLLTAFQELKKT